MYSITGETKAIQLQRQLDQVKNEKFRTEAERDELKHKTEEAEAQVRELYQKCRELTQENQEIPILRDSLEEMKYLQSKVVRVTLDFFLAGLLWPELGKCDLLLLYMILLSLGST